MRRTILCREGLQMTTGEVDAFPTFNPHKDIAVGQFVAVVSPLEDKALGTIFYVGKVRALERGATPNGSMTMLWYWPKMPQGSTDAIGEWHKRYANWETRSWEPSKEDDDNILVSTAMTAWTNPSGRCTPMCTVHGICVEKKIRIPEGEVYHIRHHIIAGVEVE